MDAIHVQTRTVKMYRWQLAALHVSQASQGLVIAHWVGSNRVLLKADNSTDDNWTQCILNALKTKK